MSYTGFRATGRNATTARPVDKPQAVAGATWFKDRSSAGADDGTDVDATWLNRLRANLENLVSWLGGAGNTGDSQLVDAFTAKFASAAAHVHDDRYYTEAEIDEALEAIDAAIALKAPLASPTFTGTPIVPTASAGTNTTQAASTAFVHTAIANLINSAPGVMDTLDELAAALGDDPNFATTMTTALALKAPLASPTFTGTPAAPTAAPGTNTTQVATTAFVQAALGGLSSGVTSFNTRTGAVTPANDDYAVGNLQAVAASTLLGNSGGASARPAALSVAAVKTLLAYAVGDVSGAAALASPTFTGTPAAPTAAQGTNTTQLATTAFVVAEVAASGGSGRTEISRSTVSSGQSSVEFNGTWTSYKALLLVATGVSGSAIAGVSVSLSDDNGSTYKPVTGVQAHSLSITYVTASGSTDTTATTTMLETAALNSSSVPVLASQSAETVNGNFSVQIEDIATLAIAKHVATRGSSQTSGLMQQSVGQTASMGAVNRVKIAATTGNIDAGTFILYGIK